MTELGMYEAVIERRCAFKKKPGGKKRCANCDAPQLDPVHFGGPPSMNNHSIDRQAFARTKEAWHRVLATALEACGLPRGLESLRVEMSVGFSTYREVDEGNHRWMVEKALGDTLVRGWTRTWTKTVAGKTETLSELMIPGGWLPDDSFWPTPRYSMGNLAGVHTPGQSSTRLMIFPSLVVPEKAPRAPKPGKAPPPGQDALL